LITQKTSTAPRESGLVAARVIEIHGTMHEVVCLACGERAAMERALARVRAGEEDPPCRTCGGILKSATISFGQGLVQEDLHRATARGRELGPDARRRHEALGVSGRGSRARRPSAPARVS